MYTHPRTITALYQHGTEYMTGPAWIHKWAKWYYEQDHVPTGQMILELERLASLLAP